MKFDYSKKPTLYVILETRENEQAYLSKYNHNDDGLEIEFDQNSDNGIRLEYFSARKTLDFIKRLKKQDMEDDCIVDCHYELIEILKEK